MNSNRESAIIHAGLIGIAVNIALASVKAFAGFMANSIAVILDAVNNLSDVLSSAITIIGTKLAGRPADERHPFGHGRFEYLTSMIIAVIILYAGISAGEASVKKIIHPQNAQYTTLTFCIVSFSVVVKIALGLFVKSVGKKTNSDALVASGKDALYDSLISLATLIAAVVFVFTGISLEAYLGVAISLFIIKSGLGMINKGASAILGERIESSFSKEIKKTVASCDPQIQGVFDLVLNNYGPDRLMGSVHIEVPSDWTAVKIDSITRKIQSEVFQKHGVILSGIGIYSMNIEDKKACEIRERISHIVMAHGNILGVHGFYLNDDEKYISFDVIVSFKARNMQALWQHVTDDVCVEFPDYKITVNMDSDISD